MESYYTSFTVGISIIAFYIFPSILQNIIVFCKIIKPLFLPCTAPQTGPTRSPRAWASGSRRCTLRNPLQSMGAPGAGQDGRKVRHRPVENFFRIFKLNFCN